METTVIVGIVVMVKTPGPAKPLIDVVCFQFHSHTNHLHCLVREFGRTQERFFVFAVDLETKCDYGGVQVMVSLLN